MGVHRKALFCHCLLSHSLLPNAYPSGSMSYTYRFLRIPMDIPSPNCQLWKQGSESCVRMFYISDTSFNLSLLEAGQDWLVKQQGQGGYSLPVLGGCQDPGDRLWLGCPVWHRHTLVSSLLLQMYFLNFSGAVAAKVLPHLMCRWGPESWHWVGLTYTEIHCLPFKWFPEDRHGSLPGKTLLSLMSTQYMWGAERSGLCCFQVLPEMWTCLLPTPGTWSPFSLRTGMPNKNQLRARPAGKHFVFRGIKTYLK